MKIETCLFDLDGTLLDTLTDLTKSVNVALSTYGYPSRSKDEVCSFIGNGVEKLIERAAPKDVSLQRKELLLGLFRKDYRNHLTEHTQPYDKMQEIVSVLSKRMKIGVISNKSHDETINLVDFFFGDTVSFALGSSADLPRKPHPSGVNKAMLALGAVAETTIYVGDSDVDVKTAKNAGIFSVGVSWGFRNRTILEEAGADIVIDHPEELLTLEEKL